jgi:hypothetical protein
VDPIAERIAKRTTGRIMPRIERIAKVIVLSLVAICAIAGSIWLFSSPSKKGGTVSNYGNIKSSKPIQNKNLFTPAKESRQIPQSRPRRILIEAPSMNFEPLAAPNQPATNKNSEEKIISERYNISLKALVASPDKTINHLKFIDGQPFGICAYATLPPTTGFVTDKTINYRLLVQVFFPDCGFNLIPTPSPKWTNICYAGGKRYRIEVTVSETKNLSGTPEYQILYEAFRQ